MRYYSVTYISDTKHSGYMEAVDTNSLIDEIYKMSPTAVIYINIQEISESEYFKAVPAKTTYCMVEESVLAELVKNYVLDKHHSYDCFDEIITSLVYGRIER